MSGWMDDYEPVEARLTRFHEQHPYGRITTELLFHRDGDYIVQATIYRGDEVGSTPPAATGLAHDNAETLPANMKASALEVCETSAIGRALANLGFAPKGQRPSREEMQKASPVPHASGANGAASAENEATRASTGETSVPALVDRGRGGTTSEGVSGAVFGEGLIAAPPSDAPFARVVEATGSRGKAREAINRVCDLEYTAKTVVNCTDEEADVTIAALAEAALSKGGNQ